MTYLEHPCKTDGPGHPVRGGYISVWVKGTGNRLRHRKAWEDTFGPIPNGFYVCHRCDNPPCWEITHLFVGTQVDNMRDRDVKGRAAPKEGSENGRARLTDEDVRTIRQRVAAGELQREVAADYGLVQPHVSRIVRRESWAHVGEAAVFGPMEVAS
jgi:hypothetical protein